MQNLWTVGKNSGPIFGICQPKFMKFVHDCSFQRSSPVVYIMFHFADIRKVIKKHRK